MTRRIKHKEQKYTEWQDCGSSQQHKRQYYETLKRLFFDLGWFIIYFVNPAPTWHYPHYQLTRFHFSPIRKKV